MLVWTKSRVLDVMESIILEKELVLDAMKANILIEISKPVWILNNVSQEMFSIFKLMSATPLPALKVLKST